MATIEWCYLTCEFTLMRKNCTCEKHGKNMPSGIVKTLPLAKPRSFKHCITSFSFLPDANVREMLKNTMKKESMHCGCTQGCKSTHSLSITGLQAKHGLMTNVRSRTQCSRRFEVTAGADDIVKI